ncbi:MAG TPA: glycoside hydrolase N-terminal domain-containing protein [Micromonosporaceae bacterium]|nr:glycoside hydrolase N-terminal domain-containing protein [Micromonosporaceae bacterium]
MGTAVNVSRQYAGDWEHAFITGNGRQGVLCYGDPSELLLTLSHERLFLPVDEPLEAPNTGRILPRLRELCHAGRYQDAADAVVRHAIADERRYRELRQADPFIGAATLAIAFAGPTAHHKWRRSVDFATGLVEQSWSTAAGTVRQEVFASRPHDLVVQRLRSEAPLTASLRLTPITGTPPVPIEYASQTCPGDGGAVADVELTARFTRTWPGSLTGYRVRCRLWWRGGTAIVDPDGALILAGFNEVVMLCRTDVAPHDGAADEAAAENAAAGRADLPDGPPDVDDLLRAHAAEHGELFNRCRLELDDRQGATTEELLAEPPGPGLVQRLFDAGRYAVISASGTLPPNLQGVWSGTYTPAWRGGYTLDGNLPAVLAGAACTGTPELLLSLFDLLDRYRADFRHNAERIYAAPGLLLPPHLTTHGRHNHFGPRWCLTFWTGGAAWMARIYMEYWRHTGDPAFLRDRALPFLREAAEFYASVLDERDGVLCLAPSYSPENSPLELAEAGTQASVNATMEIAGIRWLFRTLIELGDAQSQRWQGLLARMPTYQVDRDGMLAEWLWPGLSNNHAHRHASHLFGLWYDADPELLDHPGLREAAVAAIRARLAWWRTNGDEMAYGLVQLGLAAAALGLADEAWQALAQLAGRYWRANLVPTHNVGEIFNIDICGGLPALVVAMVVRGRPGRVDLLPALPATWSRGAIRGVLLRDGISIRSLTWTPYSVAVELSSARTQRLEVTAPADSTAGVRMTRTVTLPAGGLLPVTFDRPGR